MKTSENAKQTKRPWQLSASMQVYRRILKYLTPYRKQFFLMLFAMIIYGTTDGVVPYLLKRVLDDVFGAHKEGMLKLLVWVIIGFSLVRGLFGFTQRYLSAVIGLSVIRDLRNEISRKLLELSPSFFIEHSTGNLIARVTNDTLLVRTALTDSAAVLLRDTVRVIALLAMAFYLDPVLAFIAFIGFPIALVPVIRFGKKVRRLSRVGQDLLGGLTGLLQETIVGHNVVQAFTSEDYEHRRFQAENKHFTETLCRAEKYGALSGPTNEIVASLAIGAVILYGGYSVISGVRTQGDFIAFITSMLLLYDPMKKTSRVNSVIQAGVAAAERIFEILDTEPEIGERPQATILQPDKPCIEYRKVSFSYPRARASGNGASMNTADTNEAGNVPPWAVRSVSLLINPGETLALVGMSGGGKSTLVNLLPRFYDPQEGEICIDGVDIRDVTLKSLRQSIAIVSQHTFLFNDTVFHNIAYGKETATEEEVERAAKAANAHTFISSLAQGYQTVIGEQGFKLSGGERARIAIARALLRDAPILILDEATASLDSQSEGLVQDAIDRLMEGRTVLVIAHRLATVRKAQTIVVMVNGGVVETGNHEQLLAKDGEYAKLYRLQFRDNAVLAGEERRLSVAGL
jgi:ATP-binding cassette, subfamily B, bacterial MsbA